MGSSFKPDMDFMLFLERFVFYMVSSAVHLHFGESDALDEKGYSWFPMASGQFWKKRALTRKWCHLASRCENKLNPSTKLLGMGMVSRKALLGAAAAPLGRTWVWRWGIGKLGRVSFESEVLPRHRAPSEALGLAVGGGAGTGDPELSEAAPERAQTAPQAGLGTGRAGGVGSTIYCSPLLSNPASLQHVY